MKTVLLIALFGVSLCAQGYATRYWDCCKPSCSWTENAGAGNEAKQCDRSMNPLSDYDAKSMCDGGPATTCLSQIPWGSGNTGYAFAATPGGSGDCGKCYKLTFTGQGKYETTGNHKALAGKTLIVMASNIGYDVAGGQFDIMIPGGGVGLFNGCNEILGGASSGAQYGGLLTDCEQEVGWNGSDDEIAEKRKTCLANKCKSAFSNSQAQQGCMFLVDFMNAAGNPTLNYEPIECPSELKSKYR